MTREFSFIYRGQSLSRPLYELDGDNQLVASDEYEDLKFGDRVHVEAWSESVYSALVITESGGIWTCRSEQLALAIIA